VYLDLFTLAQTVGLPVAMVLFALITGYWRWWVWGTELVSCEKRMDEQKADYEARLTKQAADYEARLEAQRQSHKDREDEMAVAAGKWQALLFESIPALKGLTEAITKQTQAQRGV
jgi:hypothetical protein